MKRTIAAALALSLIGGSIAVAQPYGHNNDRRDVREARQDVREARRDVKDARKDLRRAERHRYAKGQRLASNYRGERYYVRDYKRHGLRTPPRGYRWQRVDNDYILAAVATGLIASVIIANN
ncbi:RcnB family protein [Caulobacter sp. NIBR2454]|uniref:RcnB family protein n=1 Tax=Caulobacter sp. NIBR2454 TaxID=3015996 RepID=UPI0022B74C94|nr:RcnB family protein [Caulobacter sp. NIBR2454]